MEFGASIFFTDYSITPAELAQALEELGFDSVWAAEHSHIPVPRKTRADQDLGKRYYDVMDPFVTLTAVACATKRLKLATGICLVIQRDTIQTAKLVASIDQVSGGRFLFGIGGGWNAEEIENHGTEFTTRFKLMREQIEAMKEIWTKDKPEYHGDLVDFATMMTWPKPVQKPYPPIIVGGAFPWAARRAIRYGDGWYPNASSGDPDDYLPRFRRMAEEAGRDPKSLSITLGGAPEDPDRLKRFRDLGVSRVNISLPAAKELTLGVINALAVHDLDFQLDGNTAVDPGLPQHVDWESLFNTNGTPVPVLPNGFRSASFQRDFVP